MTLVVLTGLLVAALLALSEGWMRFTAGFVYAAFARAILVLPER